MSNVNVIDNAEEDLNEIINHQRAEIERLEKENKNLLSKLCKKLRTESKAVEKLIKAEAIKEFLNKARELSYESNDWSHSEHPFVVEWDDLVTIYDEMVGDGNV